MEKALDNAAVRDWYRSKLKEIPELVDKTLPLEEQAKQAFELRNFIRTQARDMMIDEDARAKLDQNQPNRDFEGLLKDKMQRKGLTKKQALRDIIGTANKSNRRVDEEFGL